MSGVAPDEIDPVALKSGSVPDHLARGPALPTTLFPAPHRWAVRGHHADRTWPDVMKLVSGPELWPGAGTTQAASDRLPAWTFARYRDDTRVVTRDVVLSARETRSRVVSVHGLMVEYIDEPAVDAQHLLEWWGRTAFVAHTTGFHELQWGDRNAGARWRVLVPFTEAVDVDTARRVAEWAQHPRHDVGMVSPLTEEVWRVEPIPAVGPGGYRWIAATGEPLDPHQAVRGLQGWKAIDTRVRAEQDLEGTSLSGAVDRLLARRRTPRLRPRFPLPSIPALHDRLGTLWPGRVLALLGSGGSGRTSLAFQIAEASAQAALPVLIVLTRMGADEAVARFLSMETGHAAPAVLQGEGDLDEAAQDLAIRCPSMHLWAPPAADRTLEALMRKVRAVSDAHEGRPPLIVIDGVEGWAVDDPDHGTRTVVAGLRDASHAGSLGGDWPGAAVVLVGTLGHDRFDPESLQRLWNEGTLRVGPLEADAGAVLVLAVDGEVARGVLVKNRDGATGAFTMAFDPVRTRFS